jgi:dipeptidase D
MNADRFPGRKSVVAGAWMSRRAIMGAAAGLAAVATGALQPSHRLLARQATPAAGAVGVPLAEVAATLDPPAVWQAFHQLTRIPRPSHHEEQVSAWLAEWGRGEGLETSVDEAGNVVIRKPATPGMENRIGVVLQAHMDMVAVAVPGTLHDFLTDPIDAYVEDGWVRARGTTLGADDGIGVATIMALLQDQGIEHGPLEALFTVDEEDGFTGVQALRPDQLRGRILINVDSEEEGVFTVGSAGGVYVDGSGVYELEPVPPGMIGMRLEVAGLKGGHSGVEIDSGRGNANRLLLRLLRDTMDESGLRLASIEGGERYNAIAQQAAAVVAVPQDRMEALAAATTAFAATVASELAIADPGVTATALETPPPDGVMPAGAQRDFVLANNVTPNGVTRMSDAIPGMVETSTNMGVLRLGEGSWTAGHYVRSAVDSERDDVARTIASAYDLGGAEADIHDAYSGWAPNPDSAILGLMSAVYREQFGRDPEVSSIHAGLETSVIGATFPGMDMISVGPTLLDVHSPSERVEIATVPMVYALLAETLAKVPAAD